jgi:cell envelope-related function transcriptional attenuator common domain
MQKNDNDKENNNQRWIDVPSFVNKGNDLNQISGNIKNNTEYYDNSNEFVREINSSLAKQVNAFEDNKSSSRKNSKKKSGLAKAVKITFFTLLTITALCCLLLFTNTGRKLIIRIAGEYIYSNLDYDQDARTANGDKVATDNFKTTDKIVNILLIGIEEIKDAQNTDSMIIATMNTEKHTLKLTSLMRDTYVHIPGHDDNRLNSAYSKGGIDVLYATIEENYGIKLDGYCMVNFKAFQEIVDLVNGVEVTLTAEEAKYLNTTNYISNWKYRTVKEGTQTLNGNQALGYCRVRKRPTATERDDFGRTQRQRIVLSAIYDKVKNKNVVELAFMMNKILNDIPIKTDITKDEFNRYLQEAMNLKVKQLKTLRLPTDDNYENLMINGKDVLTIKDWQAAKEKLHKFIYGSADDTETTADKATSTGENPTSDSAPTK